MTSTLLKQYLFDNSIFYSFYQNLPKAIFIMDLNGNYIHVNRSAEHLTGYTVEECLSTSFLAFIAPEKVENTLLYFKKALKGEPQEYENVIIHKEGHRIDVDVTIVPITLHEKMIGFIVLAKDITKENHLKKELRTTKVHLESFINNSADAIVIQDLNGTVLRVNKSFENMFGYTAEEMIGRDMSIIVPQHLKNELGELRKKTINEVEMIDLELIRQRKDGQLITISLTKSPIRDADGNIIAISGIARDITERKQSEEKLRKSQENLAIEQRISQLGSWEWNVSNNTRYWSEEAYRIFGIQNHSLNLTPELFFSLIHEEDLEMVKKSMRDLEQGIPFDMKFRIVRPDGSVRIVHKLAEIEFDRHDKIVRVFGTIQDITERKQTQDFLMKSEKLALLGQLAAGIGHEIRNPLTSIKGFVQLIQTKIDNCQEYFEIILSELNRINRIVSEFMVLAKPQVIKFQPKDVVSILQNVVTLLDTQAILTNVQIFTVFDSDIPLIHCEENQIKQVFINILKNSIDAMPNSGKITVYVKRQDQESILIRFIDEGCGIPEELISRLGEPFYTTKEKGTGLGLMVTHKIIENHQGNIQITSEIGKGTTVDVILPISTTISR